MARSDSPDSTEQLVARLSGCCPRNFPCWAFDSAGGAGRAAQERLAYIRGHCPTAISVRNGSLRWTPGRNSQAASIFRSRDLRLARS